MSLPLLTARLCLRGPRPDDFDALLEGIWSSPEVMRFIGEVRTRAVAEERFAWSCDLFARTGMALWTVEDRGSGRIIGDCGVIPLEGKGPQIELGYRLRRSSWGLGLATEAASAALGHATATREHGGLGIDRVVAVADPDNAGSRRVLDKIGMRFVELTERHYGSLHALYETAPAVGGS